MKQKFKIPRLLLCLLILTGYTNTSLKSQHIYEVYVALVGEAYISGEIDDTAFTAVSKECVVKLNYETGEFYVELDPASLVSENASFNELLSNKRHSTFKYFGQLGIDLVRTSAHPTESFSVEGYLNCAPHNDRIAGSGVIEHIFGDLYSCIMNLSFHIDLTSIFADDELPGLGDEIHIEILQAILKRSNE